MDLTPLSSTPSWTDQAPSCTLPTTERPLRQAEFDGLFAETLVEARRHAADHATLLLSGPAGTGQRTRDLAARESSCCLFFDFTVTSGSSSASPERVTLEVRVPVAHTDVLSALVARAQAAGRGAA